VLNIGSIPVPSPGITGFGMFSIIGALALPVVRVYFYYPRTFAHDAWRIETSADGVHWNATDTAAQDDPFYMDVDSSVLPFVRGSLLRAGNVALGPLTVNISDYAQDLLQDPNGLFLTDPDGKLLWP
jgi:hypothetical protein